MTFGEFIKQRRIASGLTLRAFCGQNGFDSGYFSRLERGLLAPPHGDAKLAEYSRALGIEDGSDEWFEFRDLASMAHGMIPGDLLSDAHVVERLPVMFQAIREIDPAKLDELIDLVRRS